MITQALKAIVIVALIVVIGGCAGLASQRDTGAHADDSVITSQVRDALAAAPRVRAASLIRVETRAIHRVFRWVTVRVPMRRRKRTT